MIEEAITILSKTKLSYAHNIAYILSRILNELKTRDLPFIKFQEEAGGGEIKFIITLGSTKT